MHAHMLHDSSQVALPCGYTCMTRIFLYHFGVFDSVQSSIYGQFLLDELVSSYTWCWRLLACDFLSIKSLLLYSILLVSWNRLIDSHQIDYYGIGMRLSTACVYTCINHAYIDITERGMLERIWPLSACRAALLSFIPTSIINLFGFWTMNYRSFQLLCMSGGGEVLYSCSYLGHESQCMLVSVCEPTNTLRA